MKKFYTLLAAAAVTLSAAAVNGNFESKQVSLSDKTPALKATQNALQQKRAQLKDGEQDEFNYDIVLGKKILISADEHNGPLSFMNEVTITKGTEAGKYIVTGLFAGTGDEEFPITATASTLTSGQNVYYTLNLPANGQATLVKYDNKEYKLYLYAYDEKDNTPYIYTNEELPLLITQDGSLFGAYGGMGLFYKNSEGKYYGFGVLEDEWNVPNAKFNCDEYDSDGAPAAAEYDLYYTLNQNVLAGDTYTFYNVFGLPNPLVLGGKDTTLTTKGSNIAWSSSTYGDFYYTNNAQSSTSATATLDKDAKKITFAGTFGAGNATTGWAAVADNCVITLDTEAAINEVSADSFDKNAPVEYFNLQGMRVNNPEGGIFIMRQGNKVAKVIR